MQLLLCTNGSPDSRVALQIGAQLAISLMLPATILGIVEQIGRRAAVQAQVDETADQLAQGGIDVDTRLVEGEARQIIVDEACRDDYLTVIGSLGIPLWRRVLWGPTIRHILATLEGPVLCVYKVRELVIPRRIVICSGGLSQAEAAVHLGGQIAAAFNAPVTLLHIATPLPNMPESLRNEPASAGEYLQGDTLYARNLQHALTHLNELGLAVDFRVRGGDPLIEILAEVQAGEYDMVVIGSHAVLTGPAYVIGDITHRIVEGVHRPVLVVKGHHELSL